MGRRVSQWSVPLRSPTPRIGDIPETPPPRVQSRCRRKTAPVQAALQGVRLRSHRVRFLAGRDLLEATGIRLLANAQDCEGTQSFNYDGKEPDRSKLLPTWLALRAGAD